MGKCRALVHALSIRSVGRRSVRRTGPHRHCLAPRWSRSYSRRHVGTKRRRPAREGPRRATAGAASIRFGHTGEQYVRARAWRDARLSRCPNHPQGRCSFARHGTYARKSPRGTRIARWYCPESHTTFSLLPDCLSARLGSRPRALCLRPLLTASVIALPPFALPASLATPR